MPLATNDADDVKLALELYKLETEIRTIDRGLRVLEARVDGLVSAMASGENTKDLVVASFETKRLEMEQELRRLSEEKRAMESKLESIEADRTLQVRGIESADRRQERIFRIVLLVLGFILTLLGGAVAGSNMGGGQPPPMSAPK